MSIFQKSVINKHLANLDSGVVEKAYQKFRANYNCAKIEEIKKLKEEQYQDGFLRDIFVDVFGYVLAPDENHNLAREFKNVADSKKADGAILKDGKAVAVIELKSTKTKDLKSVTEQAFGYKHNQPDCKYVIISNFQKLQFYIDYANEFEEFDLFNLQKDEFELLYLLLNSESIFSDLPLKLKTETKFHEEDISDKLYKDYSIFKRKLFENLIKNNLEHDKLTLFKKSQKLLDRFLFILFAEDSGLLPPNSITRIIDKYNLLIELDEYKAIYEIYKQYFGYMNIGRKGKTEADKIPAYNGGLFYHDELLDSLMIDDEILIADLLKLSEYDFNTEVDVNILGHIFEHSLNEIEEITAEIEGTATDKQKSKRKKDGVFYTPKYITQYIVENTVGTLCKEKRKEFGIAEIEFDGTYKTKDGKLSVKGKKLFETLEKYKEWLLTLKIVDPACGSGAFLNQALNFLIAEHKSIDDIIAELTNTPLRLFDTEKSILENNLYGVDINEESVEIAKLSLWLRTARKDRKLSNLNNNIKCGNSLIDDPEIAGDKAFNWNEEFADIMQNGGFDVVIGNPPYVRQELIVPNQKKWLVNSYEVGNGTADLYVYFYQKSLEILRIAGILGFITPNKFYKTKYGKELRAYLKQKTILKLIDFFELPVFDDATTDSQIIILKNKKNDTVKFKYFPIKTIKSFANKDYQIINVEQNSLRDSMWIFLNPMDSSILYKISMNSVSLGKFVNNEIYLGVKTAANNAFIIDKRTKDNLIRKDPNSNKLIKKYINAVDIKRYHLENQNDYYLINTGFDINVANYPAINEWLSQFEKQLIQRTDKGVHHFNLRACSYYDKFEGNKIMYIYTAINHNFKYDSTNMYVNNSCFIIGNANKFLSAWLNSSIFNYYKKLNFVAYGDAHSKGRVKLDQNKMKNVPIPTISDERKLQFEKLVDIITEFSGNHYQLVSSFLKYIKSKHTTPKFTKKLKNWHELEFAEFIKELNKAIKKTNGEKLTKKDEMEWMELFEEKKAEVQTIKAEIDKTDKEIDQMVYELYGLSEEEIEVVEGSV